MNTGRKTLLWGGLVAFLMLILLAIALVLLWLFKGTPKTTASLPATASMQVTLSAPYDHAHYPLNATIPVKARVTGEANAITLWVDGVPLENKAVASLFGTTARAEWHWSPTQTGSHSVLARATDAKGNVSVSNLVWVIITDPTRIGIQISAQDGDTLASLAEKYGVSPNDIQTAIWDDETQSWIFPRGDTPAPADPQSPLKPGQPVIIGTEPPPAPNNAPEPAANHPIGESQPVTGIDPQQIEMGNADSPPTAPTLTGTAQGCNAVLYISDAANNEAGFWVSRQTESESVFQRIATLPPNDGNIPLQFTDFESAKKAVYLVTAFNAAGKASGNPVAIEITDASCLPSDNADENTGVQIIGSNLQLPHPVNRAYFYLSPDGENWHRVPEDPNAFLSPDANNLINMASLFAQNDTSSSLADNISVNVWGWQHGELSHLGDASHSNSGTTLKACIGNSGDCKDTSARVTQVQWDWNHLEGTQQFDWESNAQNATRVVWQFSETPFPPGPVLLENVVTQSQDTGGYNEGTITFDIDKYFHGSHAGGNFFVRLIPFTDDMPAGEPSNTVLVSIGPPPPQSDVTLYAPPDLPAAYDVKIAEFRPVHFPESGVCHGAVILDTDWVYQPPMGPSQTVPAGTRLCPETYKGIGEAAWYESFWDFVKGAVNWISKAYESLKQAIVDVVGSIVCGGDETCKDVLMMGLNAGLAALGVPPSLPNFDQLMDQGLDYLAAEIASEITGTDVAKDLLAQAAQLGISEEDAQAWVQQKIKEGLTSAMEAMSADNPACTGAEEAHRQGLEPLCLPDGVKTHLDPAGQLSPATLSVKITRKQNIDPMPSDSDLSNYVLSASNMAHNEFVVGSSVWVEHTHSYLPPIDEPLNGSLFEPVHKKIPLLSPGQSVTIPIVLDPTDYWAPGHKEAEGGWIESRCDDYHCFNVTTNDWWLLYHHATDNIRVDITPPCNPNDPSNSSLCEVVTDTCQSGELPRENEPYSVFCQH